MHYKTTFQEGSVKAEENLKLKHIQLRRFYRGDG